MHKQKSTHIDNSSQALAHTPSPSQEKQDASIQIVNNQPEASKQRKIFQLANNSTQAQQGKAIHQLANNSTQAQQGKAIHQFLNSSPKAQEGKKVHQLVNKESKAQQTIQLKEEAANKGNKTGLPDALKTGVENLSGMTLNDVKVHRNSSKPAQLQAHAFAQGTDIHVGPGQERHLPHEAWHVVQQKQGRVKPTMEMKANNFGGPVKVNDNKGLEKEADAMGAKALGPLQRKEVSPSFSQTAIPDTENQVEQPSHDPSSLEGTESAIQLFSGKTASRFLSSNEDGSGSPSGQPVVQRDEAEVNAGISARLDHISGTRITLEEKTAAAETANRALSDAERTLEELNTKIESDQTDIAALKAQLTQAQELLTEAQAAHAALRSQLPAAQAAVQEQEGVATASSEQSEAAHAALQTYEEAESIGSFEERQQKLAVAQSKVDTLRTSIKSREEERLSLLAQPDAGRKPLRLARKIEKDKERLARAKEVLSKAKEAASGPNGKLLQGNAEQAAAKQVAEAQRLEELQKEVEQLETRIEAAAENMGTAESAVTQLAGDVESSEATLATDQASQSDLGTQVERLRADQVAKRAEMVAAKAAHEEAIRELAGYVIQATARRIEELTAMGLPQEATNNLLIQAAARIEQGDPEGGEEVALQAWRQLPSEAHSQQTEQALGSYNSEMVTKLQKWVYKDKLKAKWYHQKGDKRDRWEKLKKAGREIVRQEIHTEVQSGDGLESRKALTETRANKEAYSPVKGKLDGLLEEIALRVAQRALEEQTQKEARAKTALSEAEAGKDPLKALKKDDEFFEGAKEVARGLVDQIRSQVDRLDTPEQRGPEAGPEAVVGDLEAEVRQSVAGVATESIEAADSEEGIGYLGKLLNKVIPDPGDGTAINVKISFPVLSDPTGAAQLLMFFKASGKAGRGTEGYVTAGIPAIASNKNHLELETSFEVGLKAVAGLKGLAGIDFSESFEAFARAGGDSTEAAMAAYRYGIYRGIGIKSLAARWYGGKTKGKGLQGADYLEAEQRAMTVEDEFFRAEGMDNTFADTGIGGKVGFSAQAGSKLGKLGAKAEVTGGLRVLTHYDQDVLGERGPVPQTQEEALERRRNTRGKFGKSLAVAVSKTLTFGGQEFSVSGAASGSSLTNWGIELKAGISGTMAKGGTPMDFVIMLATAMYELEHKLLNAVGNHLDSPPPDDGMTESELKDQLAKTLIKRDVAVGAEQEIAVGLSALGLAESSMAVSFQFGLADGKVKTRFDIITSTKVATPEDLSIFGISVEGDLEKETRFMTAEYEKATRLADPKERGRDRSAFMSPGVLGVKKKPPRIMPQLEEVDE